jgi:hypothetical protein
MGRQSGIGTMLMMKLVTDILQSSVAMTNRGNIVSYLSQLATDRSHGV